jgi:hypothetical protein
MDNNLFAAITTRTVSEARASAARVNAVVASSAGAHVAAAGAVQANAVRVSSRVTVRGVAVSRAAAEAK